MSTKKREASGDRKSDSSLSSLEDEQPAKRPKSSNDVKYEKSASGDKILDLTGKKFVSVRCFRGRVIVDIREYYEDKGDGSLKPGKKGISLNRDQWENLKNFIDTIETDIKNAQS